MPANLFCNCMRCCRSSARHAFSPSPDLRTCRKALPCTTSKAARIANRVIIIFVETLVL